MPAELVHRDLEARARPRRRLLEHHAQHAPGPASRAASAPPAARAAPRRARSAPRCRRREDPRSSGMSLLRLLLVHRLTSFVQHVVQDLDRLVDLGAWSTTSGRHETHDVGARQSTAAGPGARARDDDVRRVDVDHQPLQQAAPARAARPGPPLRSASRSSADAEVGADVAAVLEQPQLVDRLLDVQRRRGRERVAAERRRVGARLEARAPPLRSPASRRSGRRPPAPWPASRRRARPPRLRTRRTCPVRPVPVWTSSKISTVPVSLADPPQLLQVSGGRQARCPLPPGSARR